MSILLDIKDFFLKQSLWHESWSMLLKCKIVPIIAFLAASIIIGKQIDAGQVHCFAKVTSDPVEKVNI